MYFSIVNNNNSKSFCNNAKAGQGEEHVWEQKQDQANRQLTDWELVSKLLCDIKTRRS